MTQENPTLTMIREFVALGRAEFDRPSSTTGDADAQRTLTKGMAPAGADGKPVEMSQPLLDLVGPRAPYFDHLVQKTLSDGITQIVNLGAGYDDRALRFRTPGVRFFELDLSHVLADKAARIEATGSDRTGLTLIATDLEADDIATLLVDAGFDPAKPTLFIAEHIVLFLHQAPLDALLATLAHLAAPGSSIGLTAEVHPDGFDSDEVLSTTDKVMFGGTSPLNSIRLRTTWLGVLGDSGWNVEDRDTVTAVNHFPVEIGGRTAQVQTQFITAHA